MGVIDPGQGAVKQSEVSTDAELPIIGTPVNQDALTVQQSIVAVLGDALRKAAFILMSDGRILWDGTTIHFNQDSQGNDVIYRILQTELTATSRAVDLTLVGTTGANAVGLFNSITLADNELLYIELDRAILLSSSGHIDIENAVSGGSLVPGMTLKKIPVSNISSMPGLSSAPGGDTQTNYIPLAIRFDHTDGITTFQDLWWIPHGIRWPANTTSTLGAVVVDGLTTWPNFFAGSLLQLQSAITALGSGGGTICIIAPFNIDTTVTIPANVVLVSRSRAILIGLLPGGQIIMSDNSELRNIGLVGSVSFNTGSMVSMPNSQAMVRDCTLQLQNTSGLASCIEVTGNYNRAENCYFNGVTASAFRIGVDYASGDHNADIDSRFT